MYENPNISQFLSMKEISSVIKNLGHPISEQEIKILLEEVNQDENGNYNFKNFFDILLKKMKEQDTEEELIEVFKAFDSDSNGLLSAKELKDVMMTIDEDLTDNEIYEMMKAADLDGDGYLNFEEFSRLMANQ